MSRSENWTPKEVQTRPVSTSISVWLNTWWMFPSCLQTCSAAAHKEGCLHLSFPVWDNKVNFALGLQALFKCSLQCAWDLCIEGTNIVGSILWLHSKRILHKPFLFARAQNQLQVWTFYRKPKLQAPNTFSLPRLVICDAASPYTLRKHKAGCILPLQQGTHFTDCTLQVLSKFPWKNKLKPS